MGSLTSREARRVSNGLTSSFCSCGWGLPAKRHFLSRGPGTVFQFPTNLWNCLNKPIASSHGSQGAPRPLDTAKSPPTAIGAPLFLGTAPCDPAGYAVLPPPGHECVWSIKCSPSHLCSVKCPAWGHPRNLRVGSPPSPVGEIGGN